MNFQKYLNGFKLVSGLLPVLKAFMEFIEVPGKGQEKKSATLEFIKELWVWADEKVDDKLPDWDLVKGVFSTAIDLGVKLWNLVGKFTHKEGNNA